MIKLIINGINGFMGHTIASLAAETEGVEVVAGVDKYLSGAVFPFPLYSDLAACNVPADVLVDFSRPEAVREIVPFARNSKIAVVLATTGHGEKDIAWLKQNAARIPVFMAANMSLGVNLQMDLIKRAASFLGDGYDIEIVEKHHNRKVDAPSGTALALANSLNEVFIDKKRYVYGRHSKTEKRTSQEIGIHAVRGGNIVGEHEVLFIGQDEVLEISHSAQSRRIFALGALRAAQWLQGKPAGFYTMRDMLSEKHEVMSIYREQSQALLSVTGLPHDVGVIADLFTAVAQRSINVDMISQTSPMQGQVKVSFSLPQANLSAARDALLPITTKCSAEITSLSDMVKLTVEGVGMERQYGVAARVFTALADAGVNVAAITTSETRILLCLRRLDEDRAISHIKTAFNIE